MQYSAVIVALFAATALAAPAETLQTIQDTTNGLTTEPYPDTNVEEPYPAEEPYPDTSVEEPYPAEEPYPDTSAEEPYPAEGEVQYATYEPVTKPCYTKEEKSDYGAPIYFAEDEEAYKKYEAASPIEEWEYPEQVDAGQDCPISYKQKSTDTYKGHYKVALCNSSDGYKTCEDVCDSYDSCKSYKPKTSYIPSDDSDKGCMYRFKAYEAENPEKCSYSAQLPIYNPVYYEENKDCKPAPEKCPKPIYAIPAKPAAPVSPVAPVKPATPVDSPAAPVAPVAYPSNDTATVPAVQPYDSGSSAVRASLSAIVGFAAVVAFAL